MCWLFTEDTAGQPVRWDVAAHGVAVGCWLGRLHARSAMSDLASAVPERGLACYHEHLRGARAFVSEATATVRASRALASVEMLLETLDRRWQLVGSRFDDLPGAFVHGDFRERNCSIRDEPRGLQLVVVDWETAGWGSPGVDVAPPVANTVQRLGFVHLRCRCPFFLAIPRPKRSAADATTRRPLPPDHGHPLAHVPPPVSVAGQA